MRKDELLDAIAARINRYTTTGDTRPILEEAAVREAEELLALVGDPSRDTEVCHLVGGLYWCRWGETANGQPTPDFERTIDLMIHVHRDRPEQVPAMLAEMFDRSGHTTNALRAGAASNEGDRLYKEYQETGDRATLDQAITFLREAAHTPGVDPERRLHNEMGLALALHHALQLDGDPDIADELIAGLEDLLDEDASAPADFRGLLVSALTYRFAATRELDDLDDAVTAGSDLYAATKDPLLRGTVCTATGFWLQYNGGHHQAPEVAELALACLASLPPDYQERMVLVDSVLNGLRTAVKAAPGSADLMRNLATVLEMKYQHTGEFAALDEAQALRRRAAGV